MLLFKPLLHGRGRAPRFVRAHLLRAPCRCRRSCARSASRVARYLAQPPIRPS